MLRKPWLLNGLLFTALAGLAPCPVQAGADRTCSPTDGAVCQAYGGCYDGDWPDLIPPQPTEGYCWHEPDGNSGYQKVKFLNPDPPGTARMTCEMLANCEFSCSAWPVGSGFSYQWTRSGPVRFTPQPEAHESYASVTMLNNSGGMIYVAVVSPSGTSSNASWGIPAGACFPY